jgi:MoaA/NifB/PqqE/SkfB family radical SAM enzyme
MALALTSSHPMSRDRVRILHNPLVSWRHWTQFRRGRLPGQVVIQYTDRCNASCAQCGMRKENVYSRSTAKLDEIKRLLDSAAAQGVEFISFTGGEPFMYTNDILEGIRYARRVGIRYIRTGTNGFMFMGHQKAGFTDKINRLAEALAEGGVHNFWISIDSASVEVHERNRGLPGVIEGVAKALPIFHAHHLYPSANLGLNRYLGSAAAPPAEPFDAEAFYAHFRDGFRRFYHFVHEMGFTIVNACYPMNFDANDTASVYTATAMTDFVTFSDAEKKQLFQAMFDTIPEFRHKLRIFTPMSSLQALIRRYEGHEETGYACRGGIDFFFVDAKDMSTYPCGFRGNEGLGPFWELDLQKDIETTAWCKQCEWECFRDPSELTGPILELFQNPWQMAKRFWADRDYARLWASDIQYYRACDFFNAACPPNGKKLARFAPKLPLSAASYP